MTEQASLSRSSFEAYASIILATFTYAFSNSPWLCLVLFIIAGVLVADVFIHAEWLPFKSPNQRRASATIGFILVLCIGGMRAYALQPQDEEKPDVDLLIYQPKSPILVLRNKSGVLADNIKYTVLLWNMDDPRIYSGANDPDGHEPLQIPSQKYDFLRPHALSAPMSLIDGNALNQVSEGQLLVGSASVICARCKRGYTYLILMKYKRGGWYSFQPSIADGMLLIPSPMTKAGAAGFLRKVIDETAPSNRVAF